MAGDPGQQTGAADLVRAGHRQVRALGRMFSTPASWPRRGEIDIVENVGFDPVKVHEAVHTEAYNHTRGNHRSGTIDASPPPGESFHVYSVEWAPDRIEVFLDGERYFASFILLNLAIGGSWGGHEGIDDALLPHFHYVDYARVYQRQ